MALRTKEDLENKVKELEKDERRKRKNKCIEFV
jgi:hypothetical protein